MPLPYLGRHFYIVKVSNSLNIKINSLKGCFKQRVILLQMAGEIDYSLLHISLIHNL